MQTTIIPKILNQRHTPQSKAETALNKKDLTETRDEIFLYELILVELHPAIDFQSLTSNVVRIWTSQEGNGILQVQTGVSAQCP